MIAQFSIVPLDKGESLSTYVAQVMEVVRESGIEHRLTPMGTVLEGSWDEVMAVIKAAHHRIESSRVLTQITIDDRKGRTGAIEGKIKSVADKLR